MLSHIDREIEDFVVKSNVEEDWRSIVLAGVIGLTSLVGPKVGANIPLPKFLDALIQVESGGNDQAVGDNGKAYGPLQIWRVVIDDVNRIYGTNYKHQDAFNRTKAIAICRLYLQHYGKHYERTTGKPATVEVLSRIWNGGPSGWTKDSTLSYWNKVKNQLGV